MNRSGCRSSARSSSRGSVGHNQPCRSYQSWVSRSGNGTGSPVLRSPKYPKASSASTVLNPQSPRSVPTSLFPTPEGPVTRNRPRRGRGWDRSLHRITNRRQDRTVNRRRLSMKRRARSKPRGRSAWGPGVTRPRPERSSNPRPPVGGGRPKSASESTRPCPLNAFMRSPPASALGRPFRSPDLRLHGLEDISIVSDRGEQAWLTQGYALSRSIHPGCSRGRLCL
jgi:hypothetical protein